MNTNAKQYYAFISYKRDDQKWAEWLQEKLEHYKLPSNLNGRGDLPKEIRPVFRDKSELAAGVLADEIQKALDNSKYLIVICSPHSAKSEWVNKEVQVFIDSGRTDKIIPFIIEGVPNSNNDETECFPKAIRELPAEDELLGVNINEMGRDAAAVKVVAQMFGLRFDDLWQRHEREKKRRRNWIITASVAAFLVMVGIAGWIWHQNVRLKEKDWKMMEIQSRLVGEKIPEWANSDSELAMKIAVELLPKDISNATDRPYTIEAENALREAVNSNTRVIKESSDCVLIDISPNGKQYITRCFDGAIRITDIETGDILQVWNDDFWGISTYSPDGKNVLMSSENKVIIRNVETGENIREWNDADVGMASYSPDGKNVLIFLEDKIIIRDIETGKIVHEWDDLYSVFTSYSPDGKYIVIVTFYNVIIKDVETGKNIREWDLPKDGYYYCASFSPDGKKIVLCSDDIIILKDIETAEINKFNGKTNHANILSKTISDDGKQIVLISNRGSIQILDIDIKEVVCEIMTGDVQTVYAGFTHNGSVISYTIDGNLRIVGMNRDYVKYTIYKHKSFITSVSCNSTGTKFVSTSFDGTVRLWDLQTGEELRTLVEDTNTFHTYASFSPDDKYIVLSSWCDEESGVARVLDAENGKVKHTLDSCVANMVLFSPDGKQIAGAVDSTIIIWDAETGNEIHRLMGQNGSIRCISYDHDGEYIVSSSETGSIIIWDVNAAKAKVTITDGDVFEVNYVSFSPDGKSVVSVKSGVKGEIDVWDVETGVLIRSMQTHAIHSMAYSADGKYIATASRDNTIKILDFETGNKLVTFVDDVTWDDNTCVFTPDGKYVNNSDCFITFTPDNRQIISTPNKGEIRILEFIPLQELIDQTRERFKNRPLTEEEKKMYYLE